MAALEAGIAAGSVSMARVLLLLALLAGCAQPGRPPVAERSPVFREASGTYTVRPGDTLYSIAWRFGLDHQDLARVNGIGMPYTIFAGQTIRLSQAPAPSRPAAADEQAEPSARAPARPPAPAVRQGAWRSPTDAAVKRGYGAGNKGIDYALGPGHRVSAAASGEVVYAGSGLGGYRHLIIVKHDSSYLSAYSLDRPMTVREGQAVKAGELLADMDSGGRRNGTLHFEVRRNGEPVDPRPLIGR